MNKPPTPPVTFRTWLERHAGRSRVTLFIQQDRFWPRQLPNLYRSGRRWMARLKEETLGWKREDRDAILSEFRGFYREWAGKDVAE